MSLNTQDTTTIGRAALGALGGALMGVFCLIVGGVGIVLALLIGVRFTDSHYDLTRILVFVLVYCGAFSLTGAVLGLFWSLRASLLGAYLLGYVGAGVACGILVRLGVWLEPAEPTHALFTWIIMTIIFGTAMGNHIHRWDRL